MPSKSPEPATESLVPGLVVPTPTLPPVVANQAPWLVVREVEEA